MGCGCGGGGAAAKAMQKRVVNQQSKVRATKPIQAPILRPTSTTRIVVSTPAPSNTIKVKQLKDLKVCPLCGSPLSHTLSGSGVRNKKQCTRCHRSFT